MEQETKFQPSETGHYFLIFKNKEESFNKQIAFQELSILDVEKRTWLGIKKIKNNVKKQILKNKTSQNLLVLNMAHVRLNDTELEILQSQPNIEVVGEIKVKALSAKALSPDEIDPDIPKNWGLEKLNISNCSLTGKGVKVGIVDSGYDPKHPDYIHRNRVKKQKTFIGRKAIDKNGHGMHCLGIAYGHKDIITGERYGIAYESDIYVCKVLNGKGQGIQKNVIEGIKWTIDQGCKVVNVSIGSVNQKYDIFSNPAYNEVISYALKNNCIVVAGVGNDSDRTKPGEPKKITSPASTNECISVTAIDNNFKIYFKANRANEYFQKINYAAPGVQIYSSSTTYFNKHNTHQHMSGTSQATPFVTGIIALLWQNNLEKDVGYILEELDNLITSSENNWNKEDYGNGVLMAPN